MTPDAFIPVGTRLDLTVTGCVAAALLLIGAAFLAFGIRAKRRKRYAYDDGEARIFVGIIATWWIPLLGITACFWIAYAIWLVPGIVEWLEGA